MDDQNKSEMAPVEISEVSHARGAIEALLFVNEKPITLDQFKKALETVSAADIKEIIKEIQDEYEERQNGMTIVEIAGGYQMLSNPLYAHYIKSLYKTKHKEKLSKPALEAMAIIAYKQPVTRSDIEVIRGVNSDGVVVHLLEKELIKCVGRKEIPGRPYLYGTTKQFLQYFGLKSLSDLPKLEEFPDLQPPEEELEEFVDAPEESSSVPVEQDQSSAESSQNSVNDPSGADDLSTMSQPQINTATAVLEHAQTDEQKNN